MGEMSKKYLIDTEENRQFLKEINENLLSFGHKFPSPGGSSYYLGEDGTPWKERNRETWITSRMAHVYSIGTFLGHEGSKELAAAAIKGLRGELHDDKNGGWYAGLTAAMKLCRINSAMHMHSLSGRFFCRTGRGRRCSGLLETL